MFHSKDVCLLSLCARYRSLQSIRMYLFFCVFQVYKSKPKWKAESKTFVGYEINKFTLGCLLKMSQKVLHRHSNTYDVIQICFVESHWCTIIVVNRELITVLVVISPRLNIFLIIISSPLFFIALHWPAFCYIYKKGTQPTSDTGATFSACTVICELICIWMFTYKEF